MFNNTRRKLALLNTLVFLLILAILGTLLYVHMRYRLIHEVDENLTSAKHQIESSSDTSDYLPMNQQQSDDRDEKTCYLLWDAEGHLLAQFPQKAFSPAQIKQLYAHLDTTAMRTVSLEDHSFRMLHFTSGPIPGYEKTASMSIMSSLEDVNHTLFVLLKDILIGLAAGAVISTAAGLFLAGRALVPIRNSWDKQQQFVADASHELRTPAAIIQAQTEMLLRQPSHTIEEESPHIAEILKESQRMSKLLGDLLTLARSDSNQLEISPSSIALDKLLGELTDHFQLLSITKEIEITADIPSPLQLWGDEGRIRQLLIILLDNALKFTPESGKIKIEGRYQANSVYIKITDNGCGIAKEDLPRIFERFYRGNKARSHSAGSSGLGLSIAKWIVDVHSGTIRVDSELGQGTEVALTFPQKKPV
ncbi:sensor histidine kinase [Paenibacillus puldeungensis]|uniref:histidine kinase n=1 Tax=Paenibacillus puldeungensis TaxID=696536 RepID=A0ABW3RU88_9BACL